MKHGLSNTRLYHIFYGMKQRCENPKSPSFKRYGGRGIKICDAWCGKDGFFLFYQWAMLNGYKNDLTIDRINSSGPYSPDNCRWLTRSDNASRANREKFRRAHPELTRNWPPVP